MRCNFVFVYPLTTILFCSPYSQFLPLECHQSTPLVTMSCLFGLEEVGHIFCAYITALLPQQHCTISAWVRVWKEGVSRKCPKMLQVKQVCNWSARSSFSIIPLLVQAGPRSWTGLTGYLESTPLELSNGANNLKIVVSITEYLKNFLIKKSPI